MPCAHARGFVSWIVTSSRHRIIANDCRSDTRLETMRIAFDHHAFCLQSHGGISRYFARLAQQLALKRQDVAIFAPLHRNAYLTALAPKVVRGVGLDRFPPYSKRLIRVISQYFVPLAIRWWAPHVVHETYYSALRSAPPGCPTVVTVYDMIHERFPAEFNPGDRTTEHKRNTVARADHVICISEHTRRDLMELFGTPSTKISVVHLGVDLFPSRPNGDAPLPIANSRPFLLYVGNRSGYKNFLQFVSAVAGSSALRRDFDILAFGGGAFSAQEQAIIASHGMGAERVRQVGGDDSVLAWLYDQAAALVYPSLYEGFGLPPLEAMVHRCPVISSNTSSMPEVIGDAAEFCDPSDPTAIADAIKRVVYSPTRTELLIRLGERRIDLFTWEDCAFHTLEIYRQTIR